MTYEEAYLAPNEPPHDAIFPTDCAPDRKDLPWTVYGIHADHEPDDPFYIGLTINVAQRAAAHNRSSSAAYDHSKALEAVGIECTLSPLAYFKTRAEARAYEVVMIALHPRLTNRDKAACTRALMAAYPGTLCRQP